MIRTLFVIFYMIPIFPSFFLLISYFRNNRNFSNEKSILGLSILGFMPPFPFFLFNQHLDLFGIIAWIVLGILFWYEWQEVTCESDDDKDSQKSFAGNDEEEKISSLADVNLYGRGSALTEGLALLGLLAFLPLIIAILNGYLFWKLQTNK